MNALNWLFDTARFTPHGFCLLWRPDLVIIHVVSDTVIALSYFAIPVAIYIFAKRRLDLEPEHRRMAMLFAAFITACGLTHVVAIVTLWAPYYGIQALIKAATSAARLSLAAWSVLGEGRASSLGSRNGRAEAVIRDTAAVAALISAWMP